MPISQQEQADLDKLKEEQHKTRDLAFMMFRDILRMDETQLRSIGQKTVEGALTNNVKAYLKILDRLVADHIKKYPD